MARRWWFGAAIAFVYLYSFPYFEEIRSANELPRIYLTMAMVDRGALDIGPEMLRHQPTPDVSFYRGRFYCNKAPGTSLLAAPVYAVQKLANGGRPPQLSRVFFWSRLCVATVPSLLFLWLLWRLLTEIIPSVNTRRLTLAGYALGSMALVYGTLLVAHQLAALLMATAFILVFLQARRDDGDRRPYVPLLAGLAAGGAVLVDYQAAFVGPPLFVYVVYRGRPRLRAALLFAAGAALPLAVLLRYQWACFDDPLSTPYDHLAHPLFRHWVGQGFFGIKEFDLSTFVDRHFSADDGLFYYSPFLLLALPGLVVMVARRGLRAEALLCAVVIGWYLYFISSLALISGWDVGPRYVVCALPFWFVAAAVLVASLDGHWYLRAVPYGLIAVSIAIYVAVSAVFPHFPDNFSNPLFDVTVRFARANYLPYNLGWLLGLEGLASVAPLAVVVGAMLAALLLGRPDGPDGLPVTSRAGRGEHLVGRRGRSSIGLHALAVRAATAAVALAIVSGVLRLHHLQLARRHRPVPVELISWMERVWEPRTDRMVPAALLDPLDYYSRKPLRPATVFEFGCGLPAALGPPQRARHQRSR